LWPFPISRSYSSEDARAPTIVFMSAAGFAWIPGRMLS
jgi:hypothetical protein